MTTVHGWTISVTDKDNIRILNGAFASEIKVTYDTLFTEYGMMHRRNGFQTTDFYRHGDVSMQLDLMPDQLAALSNHVSRSIEGGTFNKCTVKIGATGNSIVFHDAFLTSFNWWGEQCELNWKFSGTRDVTVIPPRELFKREPSQILDWRVYGF